ncbi:hypothetical protein [Variovorax sp. ZT4R33]|uniref:hypothetical protein n=1 Tax=Variovorax sp. ZT4R33 TaxID=3443743 RepID=UPI003F4836ED
MRLPRRPRFSPTSVGIATPPPLLCALLIGATLGLAACGGGGGDGGSGATSSATGSASTSQAPNQTAVDAADELPASAYAAASGDRAAWTLLQQARTQCGFGNLEQNTRLDAASRTHGQYLLAESRDGTFAIGHEEANVNNPHFTGRMASDRALYASYGAHVTELLTASIETYVSTGAIAQPTAAQRGARDMRSLLNSVAHLSGAMSSARVGGLAAVSASTTTTADGRETLVVNHRLGVLLGQQERAQLLGAGKVASYPCAGSVDIDYAFAPATEEPNPFPEVTDRTVQFGPPIYLRADEGADLRVTAFALKDSSGAAQPVRTDAVPRRGHEFFMVPKNKLAPGARYTVELEGAANGAAFRQTFDFRTRS